MPKGFSGKNTYVSERMQKIAHLVDEELPDKWGFFVMAFPFGEAPGRLNYVSNATRVDVINEMKAFIEMNEAGINVYSHVVEPKCTKFGCNNCTTCWRTKGESFQSRANGHFTITQPGWYCPNCGGGYGGTNDRKPEA